MWSSKLQKFHRHAIEINAKNLFNIKFAMVGVNETIFLPNLSRENYAPSESAPEEISPLVSFCNGNSEENANYF